MARQWANHYTLEKATKICQRVLGKHPSPEVVLTLWTATDVPCSMALLAVRIQRLRGLDSGGAAPSLLRPESVPTETVTWLVDSLHPTGSQADR